MKQLYTILKRYILRNVQRGRNNQLEEKTIILKGKETEEPSILAILNSIAGVT